MPSRVGALFQIIYPGFSTESQTSINKHHMLPQASCPAREGSAAAETAMLAVAAEEPSLLLPTPRDPALAARPEPPTGAEQQVLLALTMMGVAAAAAAAAGEAEAAVALAAEMDVAMATLRAEGAAAEAAYVQAEHEATDAHLAELPGEGAPPAGPSSSNAGTVARGRRAEALRDRARGKCSTRGTEAPLGRARATRAMWRGGGARRRCATGPSASAPRAGRRCRERSRPGDDHGRFREGGRCKGQEGRTSEDPPPPLLCRAQAAAESTE